MNIEIVAVALTRGKDRDIIFFRFVILGIVLIMKFADAMTYGFMLEYLFEIVLLHLPSVCV